MSWIPKRHDGGYARETRTDPKSHFPNHTETLWTDEEFPLETFGSQHTVLGKSTYDHSDPHWGGCFNQIATISLRREDETDQLGSISFPGSLMNLESEKRLADRVIGKEIDTGDPGLTPRGHTLMAPPTPPRSNNSVFPSPVLLEQHLTTNREPLSPQNLEMDSPKLVTAELTFAAPEPTSRLVPGPGPGPGPGPRASIVRTDAIPKTLEVPSTDRPKTSGPSLKQEWQRIERLRLAIWSLRNEIQYSRKALREKQLDRSIAEDRCFQHVRMHSLGVSLENQDISRPQKSMTELMEDCQRIRDEYGPMEDDCNLLEDQLQRDEFKLNQLEKSYHKRQSEPEDFQEIQPSSFSESYETSSDSDSEVGQESHPLVSQYLYKLGEADNLKDRLDEHVEEIFALKDQKEARQLIGQDLDPDDQEWLDNFEQLENTLLNEIHEVKADAERLKKLCFEQGLVDEDGNPTDFENQERSMFMNETPDVDAGSERSEFVKFPVLIPRPGNKELHLFKSSAPRTVNELSHNAGDHINQWLLHQLRCSPLDVNLLARTFEAESGLAKGENWQFDVLEFWYQDGARKEASAYRIYSSGVPTQVPQHSQFPVKSYASGSDQFTVGIAIRGASLRDQSRTGSESLESVESTELFIPIAPPVVHGPKLSRSI